MIYYHAAKLIQAMTWEIKNLMNDINNVPISDKVYNLRSRFETLTHMVERADRIFGAIIVICHGILFFCICATVYIILYTISNQTELRSTVAYLSHRLERSSDKEERRIVRSFYGRLKETKLAACPSGFYKVKPSVLLTLLSLVVSYTIILLQTNNNGGPTKNVFQNKSIIN